MAFVVTLIGLVWLALVVLALGLCLAAGRAERRAGRLADVHDLPSRERIPPSRGASGAA